MPSLVRRIVAGAAGVVAAFATVAAVEALAHAAFPRGTAPPASDRAAVADYVATLPAGALLTVALAWALAVLAGTAVAVAIARGHARRYAVLVGGVIALSAVLNFVLIPHPAWFMATGLAAVLAATGLASAWGGRATARRAGPDA